MLERIIKGDSRHQTRFHDFEGNSIPLKGLLWLPRSLASALLAKLGYRACLPWLSYPAINKLSDLLARDARVLEFGSGSSSVWLSKRCGQLVTIEGDRVWYESLRSQMLSNVDARLCEHIEDYTSVKGYPDRYFDLVIVDGHWRDRAMEKALRAVKIGSGLVTFGIHHGTALR
jgi:hypothetical protein